MAYKVSVVFTLCAFVAFPAIAQTIQGPLQAQNSLAELAANGTQATARTNIGSAARGANSDITSITGLTTPLAGSQGGTGVNNGASLLTLSGSLTTAGGHPITLTATGTTSVTLPTNGTLFSSASSIPNMNLSPLLANQLLGALTATTPSGQSVPSCSGANASLQWTSGVGFGCVTISAGTNAPGGSNADVQFNNATAFGGNSNFTYNGTGSISLGTSGAGNGAVVFGNTTSGTITLSPPTGALGTVIDTLPVGGTLLTVAQANATYATSGANSNITSLAGLTTPLSPFQGGDGVQNGNSSTETRSGAVSFLGGSATTFTVTGTTSVTLPTSGVLISNISTGTNTVLASTSSTTIAPLTVPSCSTSTSNLQWTSGTGFTCGTITGAVTQTLIVAPATTATQAPQSQQSVGGIGQSYINETGSRTLGTLFTNNTGGAMAVSASISDTVANAEIDASVGGVIIAENLLPTASAVSGVYFIVPAGSTYEITVSTGTGSIASWFELAE